MNLNSATSIQHRGIPVKLSISGEELTELVSKCERLQIERDRAVARNEELVAQNVRLGERVQGLQHELVVAEDVIHNLRGIIEDQLGYVPETVQCRACGTTFEVVEELTDEATLCSACDGEEW